MRRLSAAAGTAIDRPGTLPAAESLARIREYALAEMRRLEADGETGRAVRQFWIAEAAGLLAYRNAISRRSEAL